MKPASEPVVTPPNSVPQRIGRYLVFGAFAQGGMASVHMGRLLGSSGFTRLVAVKRLHPLFVTSPEHAAMLLDEARITARVRHPNVVPIFDVVNEDGHLFLIMEYVAGVSLADLLASAHDYGTPIPPPIVSAIVVDLLRGLHAAHEARDEDGAPLGVVHRDVSPHNVLVGADGAARVLDFGIAKALRKDHLTLSGDLKGKASYMAPEQLRGMTVTRQTDVFAAGIVLWEALTGRRLFDGEPATAMLKILEERPGPPSAIVGDLSPSVDACALRALAAAPRARFETAEAMAVELIEACPPATREEVVRFLDMVASDELDRRAQFARQAERAATPIEGPTEVESERVAPVVTGTALTTGPARSARTWQLGAWLGMGAFAIAALVALWRFQARDDTPIQEVTATPAPAPAPPSAAVPAPSTPSSARPEPSTLPSTLAISASAPPVPMTASATAARPPAGARPVVRTTGKAAASSRLPPTKTPQDPEDTRAAGDRN